MNSEKMKNKEGKGDKAAGFKVEEPDKLYATDSQGDLKLKTNAKISETKETRKNDKEGKRDKAVGFKVEGPDKLNARDGHGDLKQERDAKIAGTKETRKKDKDGTGDKAEDFKVEEPGKLNATKGQGDLKKESNAKIDETKKTKKEAKSKKTKKKELTYPKKYECCASFGALISVIVFWIIAKIAQLIAITGVLAAIAVIILVFMFGTKLVSEMTIANMIIKSFCLYQPKVENCDFEKPKDIL